MGCAEECGVRVWRHRVHELAAVCDPEHDGSHVLPDLPPVRQGQDQLLIVGQAAVVKGCGVGLDVACLHAGKHKLHGVGRADGIVIVPVHQNQGIGVLDHLPAVNEVFRGLQARIILEPDSAPLDQDHRRQHGHCNYGHQHLRDVEGAFFSVLFHLLLHAFMPANSIHHFQTSVSTRQIIHPLGARSLSAFPPLPRSGSSRGRPG